MKNEDARDLDDSSGVRRNAPQPGKTAESLGVEIRRHRQENEELRLIKSIADSSPEAIAIADADGWLIYVNPAWENLFWRSKEEALQSNCRDLVLPEFADLLNRDLFPGIAKGDSWEGVLKSSLPDGQSTTLWTNADLIPGTRGKALFKFRAHYGVNRGPKSEEALGNKERCDHRLADNAPDIIYRYELKPKLRCVYINQAVTSIIGYTPEEYYINPGLIMELIFPDDLSLLESIIQEEISNQPSYSLRVIRKDGKIAWIEHRCAPIRDDGSGEMVAIEGVGRDITERKRMEMALQKARDELVQRVEERTAELLEANEALRVSEERFRLAVDNMPDAFAIYDPDLRFKFASARGIEVCGRTADELLGHTDEELFPPDVVNSYLPILKKAAETRRAQSGECTVPLPGGAITCIASYIPLLDDSGAIKQILAVTHDITERKKIEDDLLESEKRLANTIDFLPDATFVIDNQGKVTAWNRAMEALTGTKAEDFLGKGNYEYALPFYGRRIPVLIDLVLTPDEEVEKSYANLERKGDVLVGEAYVPNLRDGEACLFGTAAPLYDHNGNIAGAIESVRDITERKQIEEALKESEAKFRLLFERSADAMILLDRERFIDCNKAALEMMKCSFKEELLNLTPTQISPKRQPDGNRSYEKGEELMNTAFEKGSHRFEWAHCRTNGEEFPVEVTLTAIPWKGRQILFTILKDITERKKVEIALWENLRFLQRLIDTIPNPIFYKDINGIYQGCNTAFEKYLGLSKEEIVRKSVYDVSPSDLADKYNEMDQALFEEPCVQVYESSVVCSDGIKHDVVFNKATYTDMDGKISGLVGVILDITERKKNGKGFE